MKLFARRLVIFPIFLPLLAFTLRAENASTPKKPNVLFIAIDDLRNALASLGADQMLTPNLDSLAASGRLFSHHYVQVPTCGASRCALLRGRYPEVRAQLGNGAIAATHSDWAGKSLPGWFKQQGYQTLALGKITHYPGGRTGKLWAEGPEELPGVWDRCWIPQTPWGSPQHLMHGFANGAPRNPGQSPPWESFEGPDESYPDAWIAQEAAASLRRLAQSEQPWFFAVGFFKPHLPFAAPQKWFDQYQEAPLPAPQAAGKPAGPSSWHGSGEFRNNYGHAGRDPESDSDYARRMRKAYAAAVSYMDAQVGRVLEALQSLGLWESTVVVAWSDHGFLLGEHAIWGKHCLYEEALRSPLIIRVPGMKAPGQTAPAVVESVDLFPTLADVCNLPAPGTSHGISLRPFLEDPTAASLKPAHGFWSQQRTLRTDRWRLIAHHDQEGTLKGVELFDYSNDPHETRNVAETHPRIVEDLLGKLDQVPAPGWR